MNLSFDRRSPGRQAVALALSLLVALLAAGCASAPPPTIVRVTVSAEPGVNPDARNRPSPVAVRVYELKSLAAFDSADFFSLYEKEQATLGGDLSSKEEMLLRPGESRTFEKTLQPGSRFIAVVAGFREVERSRWRASATVPPNKMTPVLVQVGARDVRAAAQ